MRTIGMSLVSVVVLIAFTAASTFAWSECPPQPPPCKTSSHAPCGSNVPSTTTTTTTTTTSSPVPPAAVVTSPPAVVAPAPVPPAAPAPATAPPPAPETAAVPEVAASVAAAPGHVPGGNVCIYTLENDNLRVDVHHVTDVNGWIASHAGRTNMPNDFVPAAGQMCGVTLASPMQAHAPAPLVSAPALVPVQTPLSPPESVAPATPPNVEVQTPPVEEVQPPNEDIPEALPNAGDGSLAEGVVP